MQGFIIPARAEAALFPVFFSALPSGFEEPQILRSDFEDPESVLVKKRWHWGGLKAGKMQGWSENAGKMRSASRELLNDPSAFPGSLFPGRKGRNASCGYQWDH